MFQPVFTIFWSAFCLFCPEDRACFSLGGPGDSTRYLASNFPPQVAFQLFSVHCTTPLHSCNRCPHFRKNKMAASKAQSRVQSEAENMLTSLEKDKVRPMQVRLNTEQISYLQPSCSIVVLKF